MFKVSLDAAGFKSYLLYQGVKNNVHGYRGLSRYGEGGMQCSSSNEDGIVR